MPAPGLPEPLARLQRAVTRRVFNPAYPASDAEVESDLARMQSAPAALRRPVLVLGGYRSPRASPAMLSRSLGALTSRRAEDFEVVSYFAAATVREALGRVHEAVARRGWTGELDVVAISMGGLVARAAAANPPIPGSWFPPGCGPARPTEQAGPPLRIARLFTLATPHRGALLATVTAPDPAAEDMEPGSAFLRALDAALPRAAYELTCYTRLGDYWVGSAGTSPPGRGVIWTPPIWIGNHFAVQTCPRILADLARRLRGERPLAQPSALPA